MNMIKIEETPLTTNAFLLISSLLGAHINNVSCMRNYFYIFFLLCLCKFFLAPQFFAYLYGTIFTCYGN